jgi:HPt (histidine-containing phosphotransfer) domain-containing protein
LATSSDLLDFEFIQEIRLMEQAMGRSDVLSGFVQRLETDLAGFPAEFDGCLARGDAPGAARAAHTLKGTCLQLGARALGALFAEIEASAKAGDHAAAKLMFEKGAGLIEQSLDALKRA